MIDKAGIWLASITGIVLGLSAGAMLTEAVILVPYWRSLPASDFLEWFGDNEARLHGFFAPLQISSTVLAVLTAAVFQVRRRTGRHLFGVTALLTVAILVTFFVYFKNANASFVAATIELGDVANELKRWESWQWIRTVMGAGAFAVVTLALRRTGGDGDS